MPTAYRIFGLSLSSEIPLPSLVPATDVVSVDVSIRRGDFPSTIPQPTLSGVLFQASPTGYLLQIPQVARYLATGGSTVLVDVSPGAENRSVALHLLSTVMTAVLHQRGMLVLHGSAVASDRGAVLFLGPSGAGKSTLAAAMAQRGFPVLTDDLCPIAVSTDGGVVLHPGPPYQKLWPSAVSDLGRQPSELEPIAPGIEKLLVPLPEPPSEAVSIRCIYSLERATTNELAITPATGRSRFLTLSTLTLRRFLVDAFGTQPRHFAAVAAAADVPLRVLSRPDRGFSATRMADILQAGLATEPAASRLTVRT